MSKKNVTIKLIVASCLALLLLANTSIYAKAADVLESSNQPEMNLSGLEDNTSVTYNLETGKIAYGIDQNVVSSEQVEIDDVNDSVSTYSVIGNDGRTYVPNTTGSPYRNVCQLTVTYADGSVSYGSGTLVYFDVLLTAGHVVYSHDHGWAKTVQVTPGKDGSNSPLGVAYATQITTSNNWINSKDYNYDWAIVDLSASFSTWQLYACYDTPNIALNRSVTAIGYPMDMGIFDMGYFFMYKDTNIITSATDLHILGIFDVTHGDSGGAIIDDKTGYLVAIISSEYAINGEGAVNWGVLITRDLFQRIKAHSD